MVACCWLFAGIALVTGASVGIGREIARTLAAEGAQVLDLLAAGIDPSKAVLYRQSDLPEVAELALDLDPRTYLVQQA